MKAIMSNVWPIASAVGARCDMGAGFIVTKLSIKRFANATTKLDKETLKSRSAKLP